MQDIKLLGILGAGQMGAGIAQVTAEAGLLVKLADVDLVTAEAGKTALAKRLQKAVDKAKIEASTMEQILSRIEPVATLAEFADVDLVIEAASENFQLKAALFAQLDSICKPDAILASNTSSISITRIAAETQRPDRVIGTHFFNPVQAMKLVELIRGLATSDETCQAARQLIEQCGKQAVAVEDKAGFVVNRILVPMLNEACFVLEEGLATAESIDTAMQLGCNHPMGPLALADFIGLDTCLAVMEVLHHEIGEDKYRPAPLLRKYVAAGWLGRKSGKGFFDYQ